MHTKPTIDFQPDQRQLSILKLMAEGLPDKRIRSMLQVSERTIRREVASMLDATGLDNRIALACWAVSQELIAPNYCICRRPVPAYSPR